MHGICKIIFYFFLQVGFLVHSQNDIVQLGVLDNTVMESSGLIYSNGRLITLNDSGNTPQLFELSPIDGNILRTITVSNAENRDWEDLAQDESYIYIGDFGNNNGDRTDLNIHRIAKMQYENSTIVTAEQISFVYEDQVDFTTSPNSNWDAEALFVFEDNLIVLTKQWQDMGTVAYRIPKVPGDYSAVRMDSYQVDGLVTGATYNESLQKLVLVGYSQLLSPFYVEIEGVTNTTIFSGAISKSSLDTGIAQVEAVTSYKNTYFITSEEFINTNPQINSPSQLFSFKLENIVTVYDKLVLYQPDGTSFLNYRLDSDDDVFEQAIFDVSGRRVFYNPIAIFKDGFIDTSTLRPSIYFLSFYLQEGKVAKPFIIN